MDDRIDETAQNPLLLFVKLYQKHGVEGQTIRAFYPTDYDPQQLNMVKKYCFPFDETVGTRGMPHKETFTFVITRENGKYNFGYCLIENDFSNNSSVVYCILSALPWRKQFYEILRFISTAQASNIAQVLQLLKKSKVPTSSIPLIIVPNRIELKPPSTASNAPSIAMMILRSSLTPRLLIEIWCSLLWERRVILKSKSLATLTDVTAALEELLCPFKWQSIYIIPMPMEMIDYCHAPTPYLIGVHSSLYQRLIEDVGQTMLEEGIAILDIDNQAFYSNDKTSDLAIIPKRIMKELEDNLKGWGSFSGSEIKNCFLTAQARLLENYRSGLYVKSSEAGVDFNKDKFIEAHVDEAHRRFAEQIVTVQMFEQFTQTKCHNMNQRASASVMDPFELKLKTMPELKNKMSDVKSIAKTSQVLFKNMVDKDGVNIFKSF